MTAREALKHFFGYDSFRKGQEDIIASITAGRDVLAIMPTGAGKSICYQVPALMLPGVCLVISPLISLMQDQVKALNEVGIHAAFINSSLTEGQIRRALALAAEGAYKIVYVAPERLESYDFLEFAGNVEISMVTVDEAHCISQWGQDFRPSYLKIVDFIRNLPKRPIVSAFTATATEEVKEDILCILSLIDPYVAVTGFDRENLYYRVESIRKKDEFVIDYIAAHPEDSGIIYCATRKNVDKLFEALFKKGVPVTRYHAGMDNEARKKSQDDFIYDRAPVIIATNAFGMGIDKSNVRYVIHYNMPQSMENYYQEAGRAGRDGENSQCILLFSAQDVMINKFLLEKKSFEEMDAEDIELIRQRDAHRLQVMEGYCKTTSCLRNYILEYFGERAGVPCDNCGNCHRDYTEVDMTTEAKWVINCIAETRGRYGQSIVVGTLLGANRARIREVGANAYRSYGALEHMKEKDLHLLIDQMQRDGYIVQTSGEYPVLQMGDITGLKREDARVMIRKFEEKEMPAASKKKARSTDSLTSAGYKLFEELRQLRLTIAKEEGMPPYIIFNDKTLIEMCVRMPENRQDMLGVSGVGENKFHKYGQRFIDAIKSFAAAHPNSATTSNVEEEGAAMYNQTGTDMYSQAGSASSKALFYIQPEDAKNFEYAEYYTISEIRDRLNAVSTAGNIKKATTTVIWDYLMTEGLMAEEEQEGIFLKSRTEQGGEQGIKAIDKVSQRGTPYQVFMYPEAVQKMIVDYFIGERGVSGDEAAALGKQANARSAWTQDEDARLVSEFKAGMKMSQIAVKHGRTNGAIKARLQKHGLV